MTVAVSSRRPAMALVVARRTSLVARSAIAMAIMGIAVIQVIFFFGVMFWAMGAVAVGVIGGALEALARLVLPATVRTAPIRPVVGAAMVASFLWTVVPWRQRDRLPRVPSGWVEFDRFRRDWRRAAEPDPVPPPAPALSPAPVLAGTVTAGIRPAPLPRVTLVDRDAPLQQSLPVVARSEPIRAWRMWNIAPLSGVGVFDPGNPVLASVALDHQWRERLERAECPIHAGGPHRVPDLRCRCGIYALKDATPMPHYERYGVTAAGTVLLTGRVLEGAVGYRAECAEIIGPLSVQVWCARTRRGVDPQHTCSGRVEIVGVGAFGYVALCFRHGDGLEPPFGLQPHRWEPPAVFMPIEDLLFRIQSRFEIRYGVEVIIEEEPTWT